jgi:lipoic acid synthetase
LVRSSYHAAEFRPELDVIEAIEADLRASRGLELGPEHLPLPALNPQLVKATA